MGKKRDHWKGKNLSQRGNWAKKAFVAYKCGRGGDNQLGRKLLERAVKAVAVGGRRGTCPATLGKVFQKKWGKDPNKFGQTP